MRTLPALGLAVLIGWGVPESAYPGADAGSRISDADDAPHDTPVEGYFTLTVHWNDCPPPTTLDEALREPPCTREMTIPHVVTGQHVRIPRASDGSCPRRVSIGESDGGAAGTISMEYEPAGCMADGGATCTNFIEHDIEIETSGASFDADRCEVVAGKVIAREHAHRGPIRHATPREIRRILGLPPVPDP